MPAMFKASKFGSKPKSRTNDTVSTTKTSVNPTQPLSSSEDDDSDSDNEGIDEEGMEMLMKALGDDGLDEFDKAQLDLALGGEGDWETDHKGDGDDEASEEDVEGGLSSGEKMDDTHGEDQETDDEEGEKLRPVDGNVEQRDEQDIALDDVESVDDDAVPRQKIEIDNEVCIFFPHVHIGAHT